MLWRVRTTLPDRPGTLAALAQRCGEAGVNILALQIFPGIENVTDELILRAPMEWAAEQVTALLEASGGSDVLVLPSREAALADQPSRYIRAAQVILERPMAFPDVVARLFDTGTEPHVAAGESLDVMEMTVGDIVVQVRRQTPFTATEHARGAALADLVSDVLRRSRASAAEGAAGMSSVGATAAGRSGPSGSGGAPAYVVDGPTVTALIDGVVVGRASVEATEPQGEEVLHRVTLSVEPAWRRRGIGTRLLTDAARLSRTLGADALVVTTASENSAVLPLVLAAGMRGLIKMADGELTVRVPVHRLKPLQL